MMLLDSLDRAGGVVAKVEPLWVRQTWEHMVTHLRALRCDVLAFANARERSDLLLVRAARLAGVPKLVMELPNLFPNDGLKPDDVDLFVAPSHYVAGHPSVQAAVRNTGDEPSDSHSKPKHDLAPTHKFNLKHNPNRNPNHNPNHNPNP